MAAYEIPNLRFSGVAAEDITRRRFIKPTADNTYSMSDAAENAVGVSYNDPDDGEVLEIVDGIVIVEAGEAVAVGNDVESGTNGVAVVYSAGVKLGTALTAASASGELITVKTIK
jgi:hypothetical protein